MFAAPVFQIGWLNAWILMLYFPLHPLLMKAIDKAFGKGDLLKKMGEGSKEEGNKGEGVLFMVITALMIGYSIFLPLKTGTPWLYAGLALYLAGLATLIAALYTAATTPLGQPFIKGVYRFSRHPLYLAETIIHAGIGIAAASWLFLIFTAVIAVLLNSQAACEEAGCLETFGEAYHAYIQRTPRWVGLPKSG